ncbi:4'-phosphopantetheinyl transferase family protein [Chryseobacterium sp. NFX27]|uniref:4'-phosphopantetheinyl transferase family protein n=1 Tax=Chryseobacterium sp. NFX27 TaxID=2819618 RepID=UPI003CE6D8B2
MTVILDKWLSFLPFQLQKINQSYRNEEDRVRNLLGKLLLGEALKKIGYESISLDTIQYNQSKKPYLSEEFDFSISHSGIYVFCTIGRNLKLGLDIEEIKPINFCEMTNIMSNFEWKRINKAPNPLNQFYKLWTLKEAAIKAEGTGFFIDLNTIEAKKNTVHIGKNIWFSKELLFDENYSGHIITSESKSDFEMIYKEFM